jgi:hypothetical protein
VRVAEAVCGERGENVLGGSMVKDCKVGMVIKVIITLPSQLYSMVKAGFCDVH